MTNPYQRDGNDRDGGGRKLSFASSTGSSHHEEDLGLADMDATTTTGEGSRTKPGKKKKKADPPTIGVLLVDQTPGVDWPRSCKQWRTGWLKPQAT